MKLLKQFFTPINSWLGISILFSLVLLIVRIKMSGNVSFIFLVWNIFLAGIPLLLSIVMKFLHETKKLNSLVFLLLFTGWLVFFPNAPYIITDLFHLHKRTVPLWFDLILILSFGWNGLLLGYFSMMNIQEVVAQRLNKYAGWLMVVVTFFLSGFGIFLGRYLRFNSWDIISNPIPLFQDVSTRLLHPFEYSNTYGVTVIFATFFLISYVGLKMMMTRKLE